MAIGVDIGTGFLACARRENDKYIIKSFRDAFLKLEANNDFVQKMLANTTANYITKDGFVYILGEESLEFASLLNREVSRPLKAGLISSDEKEAREILEIMLQSIVGTPKVSNEKLYFSIPAGPIDTVADVFFHEFTFKDIFDNMGYNSQPINESLAVIYSNAANDNMTAIAISHGAGMTNLTLSLSAVPITSFSLAKSGDWIDQQAARACGITANKIRLIKEKGVDLTIKKYSTKEETAIYAYYYRLIELIIQNFKQEFKKQNTTFDKPIPIILSGGTSLPGGFDVLFKQVLDKSDFPLQISEVRRANDPLNDVAKGCLLAALADEN